MKIISAYEADGMVTATVRFADGLDQTVHLPSWASKENIRKEAKRLREAAERRERQRTVRSDLME